MWYVEACPAQVFTGEKKVDRLSSGVWVADVLQRHIGLATAMLLFSGGLGEGVLGNPDVLDRLICFEDRRAKHMFGLFVVDVVIWKRRVFC